MKRVTTVNRWYVLFAACGLLSVGACVDEYEDAPPLPGAAGPTLPLDAGAAGASAGGAAGAGGGTAGTGGGTAGTGAGNGGSAGAAGTAGAAGAGGSDEDAGADAG